MDVYEQYPGDTKTTLQQFGFSFYQNHVSEFFVVIRGGF